MYYIINDSVLIKCDDIEPDEYGYKINDINYSKVYASFKNVNILGLRHMKEYYPFFDDEDNFLSWILLETATRYDIALMSKNDTFSTLNAVIDSNNDNIKSIDVSSDEEAELFFEII